MSAPTLATTAPDALDAAAKLIEQRGHGHGWYQHPATGCLCVMGALSMTTHGASYPEGPFGQVLDGALAALVADIAPGGQMNTGWPSHEERILEWNDEHSGPEVIATLIRVAAKLRQDGDR